MFAATACHVAIHLPDVETGIISAMSWQMQQMCVGESRELQVSGH